MQTFPFIRARVQVPAFNQRTTVSWIVLAIIAAAVPAWCQVTVLTHHNDNRRTGANLQETELTVASVKQKFGKLWTLFADGQIVAQPLYVSGLTVAGRGTFNALIVSTMHDTIYAYDADKKPMLPQSQDALIWAQWLGQPQSEKAGFDSWNTNFPEYGIKNDIFRSSPPDDPAGPNAVGLFGKFAPPTVANGKVFVATYGDHENPPGPKRYFEGNRPANDSIPKNFYVAVYGLKP
jgi:hypothetical protein